AAPAKCCASASGRTETPALLPAAADELRERILAEWTLVLHAQAVGPFAVEVALVTAVDRVGHEHRDQRAEARERHVLVRIPLVPLGAEVGLAEVAAESRRGAPLDQLEQHRGG